MLAVHGLQSIEKIGNTIELGTTTIDIEYSGMTVYLFHKDLMKHPFRIWDSKGTMKSGFIPITDIWIQNLDVYRYLI